MPSLMKSPARLSLPPRLKGLAYRPESGRDLRIDFLRGFAVFAMVVDHLAGPSRLYYLTGGNRFYTSAAEGFVFISGLIVGMVYRRMAERDGLGPTLRRLLERAWVLYVLSLGLTLTFLPLSEVLNLPWAQGVDLRDPAALIWNMLILHQTYYLVDIPLLYTLLMGLAPLALLLMYERRTWVVLVASWLLWAGHQIFPLQADIPWPIAGNYLFYFAAWQVLFFTAMVIGYHHERVGAAFPRRFHPKLLAASGLGFVVLLFLFRYTEPLLHALASPEGAAFQAGQPLEARLVELLFAKGDVRIGRLVGSAVVFSFLFLLVSEFWKPLHKAVGWLFIPLGQNALYAYSAHIFVAAVIGLVVIQIQMPIAGSPGTSAAIQVASVLLIWLGIRLRAVYPSRQQLRYWMASPIAMAIALLVLLPVDPSPQIPGLEPMPPPAQEEVARARAARVFGTPIPRQRRVEEAARIGATPVPLPPPPVRRQVEPQPPFRVESAGSPASEYVGEIQGVLREQFFYSPALDRDMPYYVYLPPDYGQAGRRYPVLYMLHGGGGDKDEWPAYSMIDTADQLIVSKEIRPFIIVLPQGDYSYWVNHVDEGNRWGDYLASDLLRHVDASYRTLPDREHRAIGGLSMGAYGALVQAFIMPRTWGAVGAHSPSLRAEEELAELETVLGVGLEFAARDPIQLAATARGLRRVQIWIDVGEEDPWLERAALLHETLAGRGIDHEWNVLLGEHDNEYWQRNMVTYLHFYDRVLNWRFVG